MSRKKLSVREKVNDYRDVSNFSQLFEKHCLIFDSELKSLHSACKRMYDILDASYQRYCRHRSLEVNPSVAQYYEFKDLCGKYPQLCYNFAFNDVRISITHFKKDYTVSIVGYDVPERYSFCKIPWSNFYGRFEKIEDCFDLFKSIVIDCLDEVINNVLF